MRRWKCIKAETKRFTAGKVYDEIKVRTGCVVDDFGDTSMVSYMDSKFEEIKDFTKADLKPCMVVKIRDGRLNMVIQTKEGLAYVDKFGRYTKFSSLTEDMTCNSYKELDIIEVYDISDIYADSQEISTINRNLLWKREEKSTNDLKIEELQKKAKEIQDELEQLKSVKE